MTLFLKFLVALLVFFVPFSFAATEPWAFSVMQAVLVFAWGLLLISRRELYFPSLSKAVFYVFFVLIGLALVQSCFAQTLLDPVPFYPITLMRLYTLEHAGVFMTYLAVVFLVVQLFPSSREVKQLLGMLLACAVLVGLCALCFPHGEYVAKLTGVSRYGGAIGPFVNRNHAGMFFVLNALVALGLFFTHQLQYKLMLAKEQKNAVILQQIVLGIITLGLMIAAVFTRSRGAMMSLLVGLFGYAFFCVWCVPDEFKKRLKGFFYTFVLLILSVGWVYTHVEDINEFAHRNTTHISAEIRSMLYTAAYDMLKQYPVWGIGIGAMPVAIEPYTQWDVHSYIERLHNDWLEITLGVGYVGAGLLLLGIVWFGYGALVRLKRLEIRKQFLFASLLSVLLAMSTGSLVDFHFFIPGCAFVFFLVLGLVLTPTFHKHHVHAMRVPILGKVVLIALLCAAGWISLQKTRCWRQFLMGKGLKTEAKLSAYEKGLALYPSPRYALRLGLAYYKEGKRSSDPMVKLYYTEQAQQLAQFYLEKYPKGKELSRLYNNTTRMLRD